MKLGIIVVYLVSIEDRKLLEIHLDQISKNTLSDYTIYANLNMLSEELLDCLNHPNIKIIKNENYTGKNIGLRSTFELAYYAEPLIKMAINEGATHIVMLHPDSFPIKKGWEKIFLNKISSGTSLISVFPAMSSIMFFDKYFYNEYHPRLLPNKKELKTKNYKNFVEKINVTGLLEPGMGYAYKVIENKLEWEILERTNRGEDHYHFGSIFDDTIFHLGASAHSNRSFANFTEKDFMPSVKKFFGVLLPPILKEKIKTSILQEFINPEIRDHKNYHSIVKNKLFSDPIGYIDFLRFGESYKQ